MTSFTTVSPPQADSADGAIEGGPTTGISPQPSLQDSQIGLGSDRGQSNPPEDCIVECCPLCRSVDQDVIEEFTWSDLRKVYARTVKVSIPDDGQLRLTLLRCRDCDLRHFLPAVTGTEEFYHQLQRFSWYYLADKWEYEQARHWVEKGDRVLEVGCGTGAFATHIEPSAYVGLELSGEAVCEAKRAGLDVRQQFLEPHAESHESEYDVVAAFQVLEHVSGVRGFLDAAVSCLKPGGRLILAVPAEDSFLGEQVNNVLNLPPHHVTRWTDACLRSTARLVGMDLLTLDHEPLSDQHVRHYSISVVHNVLRNILRIEKKVLDARLSSLPARALAMIAARPVEWAMSRPGLRPRGHSVIAVFGKS